MQTSLTLVQGTPDTCPEERIHEQQKGAGEHLGLDFSRTDWKVHEAEFFQAVFLKVIASKFLSLAATAAVVQCQRAHLPMEEMWVRSLGWEDPLEKEMATHSSILAWKIPWTEEPGGLQSMGFTKDSKVTLLNNNSQLHVMV